MAAVPRNPQGAYNDPYSRHNNNNNNNTTAANPQYTGLNLQQQQQQQQGSTETSPQSQQPSKKALAITSRATRGSPPPPLMGSAIVLVNDSALHCFGGRLDNRELTNCHYVLDVETGYWQTILPAPATDSMNNNNADRNVNDPRALFSLSLTTDPVNTNSGSLSDTLSIPPQPRYFHTVNAYGTSLILFGGMGAISINRDGEDSDNEGDNQQSQLAALADLHVYDIITQRWQQKTPTVNQHTPRARWAHLAAVLDHFLVVIGGTDTNKNYVEDACVLDLHTWEWVASIQNIGQCGSYRTIAATGPSLQTTAEITPSTPSFPSADAFSPQISSNLSWPTTEDGAIDAMASISQVLSGRISAPSSTSSSLHSSKNFDSQPINTQGNKKATARLMSGDLTPAFKAGSELPSIYLYSNYNFQNLRRELKIITPQYTHPSASVPTFSIVEKTEAFERLGQDHPLPPGLRFPQGHVYQNQLILTGTLIVSGKAPTLAIYSFNLITHMWDRLDTDTTLDKGSWNRSLLHPATGTLLIFGHYESNADSDYSNRIQHHNHLMMVNLQAYGLYERPIPSFLPTAQDLGHDLLREPGLNDMEISSINGTLFGANSTILAARWPEFATMLLSPPYVTPLILELPVPDEVVPMFLYYLYTGALPLNSIVTPGVADYLLILARRYQLNGLHALAVDILHQTVTVNPIRVYSSALMAGELGLQARAVELAMNASANKAAAPPAGRDGASSPSPLAGSRRRISAQPPLLDSTLSRNYSNRVPPPSSRLPFPPQRRRAASNHSRDSVSTDGGLGGDSLMQQYNTNAPPSGGRMAPSIPESGEPALYLSSPEPGARMRKMRSPPMPPNMQHAPSNHPLSYMSNSSGGSMYDSALASPGLPRNPQPQQLQQQYQQQYHQQAYPSPLSPNIQTQPSFSAFSPQGGYAPSMRGGSGSDGSPSVYGQEENDDGSSTFSGYQGQGDLRAQQAKRRLQMQMQYDMEQQQQYRMRLEYAAQHPQQQQHLVEQQQLRDAELILQQQQQLQLQQQQQQQHRYLHGAASSASLSSKVGGGGGYAASQIASTAESIAETTSSHKSSNSSKASIKSSKSDQDEKKKGVLAKFKPPKPKASGAALMKSAGF